jgi:positive regulator of sigma E activity
MVGIACIQMISFDTLYRHVGRALSSNRRIIYFMPPLIILLIVGHFLAGIIFPVTAVLAFALVYGFLPTVSHFVQVLRKKNSPSEE